MVIDIEMQGSIHGLVNLTISNCLSDVTLNRGRVRRCCTPCKIRKETDGALNSLPADIAQSVERRTREHNVSGHYSMWVRIPGWLT